MVEGRRRGDGVLLLLSAAQTAPSLLLLLLLLRPLRLLLCRDEACRRARARAEAEINPRAAVRGSCVSSEQLRGVQTPLAPHSAHARTHTRVARPRCARALARSFQRAPAWRGRGGGRRAPSPMPPILPYDAHASALRVGGSAVRQREGAGGLPAAPSLGARRHRREEARGARRVPFRDCARLRSGRCGPVLLARRRHGVRSGAGLGAVGRGKGRVGKHTGMHTHVGSQSHTHACARARAVRVCGRARAKPLC